jgi:hypothetical protein
MCRSTGHVRARTLLTALLITLAVGVLPMSTLLHHTHAQSSGESQIQQIDPMHSDGSPSEDPADGQDWAPQAELPVLLPPFAAPSWPHPDALHRVGHLRRIDRPPTA